MFVSSYHQGYSWADGIERGVHRVLEGKCELKQINMDTKRNKDEAYKVRKGKEVRDFIEAWRPDVVIAADDNASKYLVMPYFKDSDIPFVFCGINWTVEEYGYPYKNVTGMIEVSPVEQLFEKVQQIIPKARKGVYIGADTLTEKKDFGHFQHVAKRYNITLTQHLASTQAEWNQHYIDAQTSDFVILGTKSGINDWDDAQTSSLVFKHGKKLSLTTYEWMVRFASLGLIKSAEEHGEWSAKTALQILQGVYPANIPVIPSQQWDMLINPALIDHLQIEIPEYILIKSKKAYADQ